MNAEEGGEKREPPYTVNGNGNWYSHCGEQYGGGFLKKLELSHDPTIPFLGVYLEKNMVGKGTCSPMFTAVLFTIAKTWKQPKCLWTDEQVKEDVVHAVELLPVKKNEIPFAVTWMDLEIIILSEISQRQRSYEIT